MGQLIKRQNELEKMIEDEVSRLKSYGCLTAARPNVGLVALEDHMAVPKRLEAKKR